MNKQEIKKAIANLNVSIKAYEDNLRSISTVNSINKDWDGISALGQQILNDDKRYMHTAENLQACKLAISALTQQLNNGWIPVSEPPTEYGTYIVAWIPTGHTADDIKKATNSELTHYYEMLEYNPEEDEEWESISQYDSYKIIAWQHLPETYKEAL